MSVLPIQCDPEVLLAELTDAAYRVALHRSPQGSFLDLELDLWRALYHVLNSQLASTARKQQRDRISAPESPPKTFDLWLTHPDREQDAADTLVEVA